jgi:hypothetical protein
MKKQTLFYITAGLTITATCLMVVYTDKESHSIVDLFKPGNLLTLTFLLCAFIFFLLEKFKMKNSVLIALSAGIPSGIMITATILATLMGKY